jgi:hypothetical protein
VGDRACSLGAYQYKACVDSVAHSDTCHDRTISFILSYCKANSVLLQILLAS